MNKLWVLWGVSAALFLGSFAYVLLALAPEAGQGYVQKIFFFHVPAALSMYIALFVGAALSGWYLYDRRQIFDDWARASLYTATFLATIVIVSGPIWAKPIWGVYWTWDPRLTTTFVVFVLLIGYCFARNIFDSEARAQSKAPLVGAILSILALLDAPLIHFSVRLWRGVHPSVLRNPDGLPESFRTGLEIMFLTMLVFSSLIGILFFKIIQIQSLKNQILLNSARRNTHA